MEKVIIGRDEYNEKLEQFNKLKEELEKLEPSDSFEYTADEVTIETPDGKITLESSFSDWVTTKEYDDVEKTTVTMYNNITSEESCIDLTLNNMIRIRDYLTHKINYLNGVTEDNSSVQQPNEVKLRYINLSLGGFK
jgi:hypothetical protein